MLNHDIHQTDDAYEDAAAAIRRQFNHRFALGLHLAMSGVISIILFVLAFTHPMNFAMWNDQLTWMGYARPDLMYAGSILLGLVGTHGLWLLWREGRLRGRNLLFWGHLLFMFVTLALTFSYLTSWYFDETYKWVDFYNPVSPGSPPAAVITTVLLLTILSVITLPVHGIVMLYRHLLTRTLRIARSTGEKAKRDEQNAVVGDDGELEDWAEHDIQAARLSQEEG